MKVTTDELMLLCFRKDAVETKYCGLSELLSTQVLSESRTSRYKDSLSARVQEQ